MGTISPNTSCFSAEWSLRPPGFHSKEALAQARRYRSNDLHCLPRPKCTLGLLHTPAMTELQPRQNSALQFIFLKSGFPQL